MKSDLYLSDERFLAALERMRTRIAEGEKLGAEDLTAIGNKYTYCTWGMCTGDPEFWPKEDRMFPNQEPIATDYRVGSSGKVVPILRVSPKYQDRGQFCPFDRRPSTKEPEAVQGLSIGCFYRCMIFSPKGDKPSREDAIKLYDVSIDRLRRKLDVDV